MDDPMFVAIEHNKKQTAQKALILHKDGYQREWVYGSTIEQYLHSLRKILDGKHKNMPITEVKRPSVKSDTVAFEERCEHRKFKFGLLYAKEGQTTEAEIFGNSSHEKNFEDFANCLASKIELRGWKEYAGGLRTDGVSDGASSYYTCFKDFEIMFHTSTLLPYTPGDPQQLDRKRHIGNDIVVLLYSEGEAVFDPTFIRSHFVHIVVVVAPSKTIYPDGKKRYKVEVAAKSAVPAFGPYISHNEEFVLGEGFREFLLTKLVNAECAAMKSPQFKEMLSTPRRLFLRELLNTYGS